MRASPTIVPRDTTRRLSILVARSLLGVACLGLLACETEEPSRVVLGRDEIVGPAPTTATDSQPPPVAPPTYASDAGSATPYGVVYDDGGGYSRGYAYSPLEVCKQCACEAGTYCFGGGTGYTTFSGACTGGGSAFGIGCQPLPAACATQPNCDCLVGALKLPAACYLVCTDVSNLTVYCPSP